MNHQKVGWRLAVMAVVFLFGVIWTVPNFVNTSDPTKPNKIWWPTGNRMVMGLDIQGGLHLVMRVDVAGALKQEATRISGTLRDEFTKDKIAFQEITMGSDTERGEILIKANDGDVSAIEKKIGLLYGNQFAVAPATGGLKAEFTELHVREFKKGTLDRAIETIRNRIDEFGVAEPSITAQGDDRILVQLPGIQDATNAKELINKTARLDFMIVDDKYSGELLQKQITDAEKAGGFALGPNLKYTAYVEKLNAALKGQIPADRIVRFEKQENAETMEAGRTPYLLMSTELCPVIF